ncbi:hypothetical protein ACHAXT_009052 [Thalassiosira profunda]
MSTDVDAIWQSLKSEDGASFADGLSFAKRTTNRARSKKPKQRFVVTKETFDIDAVSTAKKVGDDCAEPQAVEASAVSNSEEDDICTVLLTGLETHAVGDSDDEEDGDEDAKENLPPPQQQQQHNTSPRIERVAKALGSDDVSARIQSLTTLKATVDALASHCPTPPPQLQYPPYSHVKLNQNLPMVSDLTQPKLLQSSTETQPLHTLEAPRTVDNDDQSQTKARLQSVLNHCGNALFRLIGDDKSEKCRVLSIECVQSLLLSGVDLSRHLPYLLPALCARYPPCTYDKDLEVFVQDARLHDFYKRGGATDRQDRGGLLNQNTSFQVIEPNEELRLEVCRTFRDLLRAMAASSAERTLDAYYPEIVFSLQTSLRDPFPEVKVEACRTLVMLLRIPSWEQGAKYFATGLARSALPNCRHRNTNVILAAMDLFEASVCVPNRAKRKGAGTAAIADLVGYREENVLPIAAFYESQCGVSVNTLAELASHKNHRVRLRCCKMLSYFLVYLPDRYDHQQRLLPYVLSFVTDDMSDVQSAALQCIEKCGLQYECEHPDEVIERRQFGVDGEECIDYDSNLPDPFACRPSLGARLYVRSNTGRFFLAVLQELSSWKEETRKRSAELLLVLTVYCEEHLTKDFQHTVNSVAKAVNVERASRHENDHWMILESIRDVLRLMAKYVDPVAYLPLVCPRISGDGSSATSHSEDGTSSEAVRSSHAFLLASLIEGSPLRTKKVT